jgi:hypothetical protein
MEIAKTVTTALLLCRLCAGQTTQAPVNPNELMFFRFMLMSVGSVDHSPEAAAAYEASLVKQFGLSAQELAVIHSAGQQLNVLLKQINTETRAITQGKPALSSADAAALASLTSQREQMITTLSNQILNSVSPTTATSLRAPGQMLNKKQ